jgi:DNA topoisomerase I
MNFRALRDMARELAIPPAGSNVWICPLEQGHMQAVGTDARGRKQYRYHPLYRQVRDATKYARMAAFGLALPKLRQQTAGDLKLAGLPKRKVIATVVRLLEATSVRVGNEEYRKQNESFGLTTLRNRHVQIEGRTLRFRFKGKSGQMHEIALTDRQLAKVVAQCQELPGYELFQYLDENGETARITSEDVNGYIREVIGVDFTAKDFRTWNGSRTAAQELETLGTAESLTAMKRNIVSAVKRTAARLGNRPATCRRYYVHPAVIDAYTNGTLPEVMGRVAPQADPRGLAREEVALAKLLAGHVPDAGKATHQPAALSEALEGTVAKGATVAAVVVTEAA